MIRRLGLCATLLLAFCTPAAAFAQPAAPAVAVPPIVYKQRTLANGLKVYSSLDKTTSNVTVQVFYGVGAKDDPQGRSGFAHLFEHMMFKATRNLPAESFDRLTEDVGGANNASTHDDFTEYHEVIPANHLERLLWAEAERMSGLVVDDAAFKSERSVVEEELRQRVLADPYGRLFALYLPEASFSVHPYKRPSIGSIEDLEAATIEDVRAFHATYYRPDNAALIVVGNFDQASLDRWVDQYFGPIRPPQWTIPRVTAVEPPRAAPRVVKEYGPNVALPAVLLTWLAPDAASPDAAPLKVAETILGGGEASRLNQDLVHDQQLAAQAFAFSAANQQPGLFAVGVIMSGGKSLDQGEAALRAHIARLRDQPVAPAELDRAKTQLVAAGLRERESAEGRAQALGEALSLQGDAGRANTAIAALQAVSAEDVQRVARRYLTEVGRVTLLYQSDTARPAGAAPATTASPAVAASPLPGAKAPPVQPAPEGQRQSPPPPAAPVEGRPPAPVERTLANSLRVIVAKSTDLPLVTAQLYVKTGGAGDPPGKAGLADLTAETLTQGAGGRTAQQVARDIEALGGSLESGATWDGVQVTLDVISNRLEPAMAIFADVVRRPTLAQAELDRVRKLALDSLMVELQDPGDLGRYVTAVTVFGAGPYGHVLSGTPGSLQRITRQDVAALHARVYRPDNAVLVLTGDIAPDRGFALAEQAFGSWKVPAVPLPPAPQVPAPAKPRVIVVDLPGTGQASVTLAMPGIRRSDPRYYSGIVANTVLGGGYSARLNAEIRIKRGLSYGAGSALDARRLVGPFVARVQTKNESAPEVAELMLAELKRLGASPADPAELAARQASLTGEYGRTLETTEGLANTLGSYALQGIPLDEIGRYGRSVRAVTPEQARAFAEAALDPAAANLIVVGDAKVFLPALKAKFPALDVIPVAQLDLDSPSLRKPVQSRQATGATRRSRRSPSAARP
jgi:zinc protease